MEFQETYHKLLRYCAYQERCLSEVRTKLRQLGAPAAVAAKVTANLQDEGFVDEERYARSYVRGKFRINGWGRLKIRAGLRSKYIPENLISIALRDEIAEDEYLNRLHKILEEKGEKTALSRGFESALISAAR